MIRTIILLILLNLVSLVYTPNKDYLEVLNKMSKRPGVYLSVPNLGNRHKKMIVDNRVLYKYYLKIIHPHSTGSYQDFLKDVFDGSFNVNEKYLDQNHRGDFPNHLVDYSLTIFKEYHAKGLEFIIGKYLQRIGENQFRNKNTDDSTLHGLIYIMSINSYVSSFSDYSGFYQFITVKQILLRMKQSDS